MKALALGMALLLLAPFSAYAVLPDEMLKDPVLEHRARDLSQQLRCLVCQNQSIDESHADLAHDLRVLVRERIKAGDSDKQVLDYLVARYGDFVMLKPPLKSTTYLLWFGPLLVFVMAAGGLLVYFRRRKAQFAASGDAATRLSREERERLTRLLDEDAQ